MRDFTKEEKELIVNTPITMECFSVFGAVNYGFRENDSIIKYLSFLEYYRKRVANQEGQFRELMFNELVGLLPNSYKLVKL